MGMTKEASAAAAMVLQVNPDWTAESMYDYQAFIDETLLPESAAKAGLPVCMTAAQLARYSGIYRTSNCDAERATSN